MSRTLPMNCGSGERSKSSNSYGSSPNARQIRDTADCGIPVAAAIDLEVVGADVVRLPKADAGHLFGSGKVEELGEVLTPGGVEGWWIPTYLAEEHPELTTIEGIMANPELVDGRFNNCPDGWGCRVTNDNLIRALDLESSGLEVFNHGSGETLATSMASAVQPVVSSFG